MVPSCLLGAAGLWLGAEVSSKMLGTRLVFPDTLPTAYLSRGKLMRAVLGALSLIEPCLGASAPPQQNWHAFALLQVCLQSHVVKSRVES